MIDKDVWFKEERKRRQALLHDLNKDVVTMVSHRQYLLAKSARGYISQLNL